MFKTNLKSVRQWTLFMKKYNRNCVSNTDMWINKKKGLSEIESHYHHIKTYQKKVFSKFQAMAESLPDFFYTVGNNGKYKVWERKDKDTFSYEWRVTVDQGIPCVQGWDGMLERMWRWNGIVNNVSKLLDVFLLNYGRTLADTFPEGAFLKFVFDGGRFYLYQVVVNQFLVKSVEKVAWGDSVIELKI